jgi:hypothetical protein
MGKSTLARASPNQRNGNLVKMIVQERIFSFPLGLILAKNLLSSIERGF